MASIVKLPIAIEVLRQVSEGTLTLDREISLAARDIRPCCTLERRWSRGPVSQSVLADRATVTRGRERRNFCST